MPEAQARIVTALDQLRSVHPNDLVAVVSHADMIKSAIAYYMGIHLDLFHRIEISPASASVVAIQDYGVQVLGINDTGDMTGWTARQDVD